MAKMGYGQELWNRRINFVLVRRGIPFRTILSTLNIIIVIIVKSVPYAWLYEIVWDCELCLNPPWPNLMRDDTLATQLKPLCFMIACWAFVLYFFDTLFITNFENVNSKYINVPNDNIVIYQIIPFKSLSKERV